MFARAVVFLVLGVVAKSKRTNKTSLESVDPALLDAKRVKKAALEGQGANITPLRANG